MFPGMQTVALGLSARCRYGQVCMQFSVILFIVNRAQSICRVSRGTHVCLRLRLGGLSRSRRAKGAESMESVFLCCDFLLLLFDVGVVGLGRAG